MSDFSQNYALMHNIRQLSLQWEFFSPHLHFRRSFMLCTDFGKWIKTKPLFCIKKPTKHGKINGNDFKQIELNILVHETLTDHKKRTSCSNPLQSKGRLNSHFHVGIQYNCQPRFLTPNPINLVVYFHFLSTCLQQHGINR